MAKDSALTIPDHEPAPSEAPPKKQIVAAMNSCKLFEQSNLIHRLISENATESDIEGSPFWSVVQSRLKSFDIVMVITAKFAYQVWILYSEIGRPVIAKILYKIQIPIVPIGERGQCPEGYSIEYFPATGIYAGVRLRDGHPITQGQHTRWGDAYHELISHAIFRNPAPNAN